MIRVMIVDDQDLVRIGLRTLLENEDDFDVAGEAADGLAAVDEAIRVRPDVILMDIRMPGIDGLAATRRIAALACGNRVSGSASKPTSNASQVSGSFRSRREATSSSALPTPSWVTRRMPTDMSET